MPPLQSTCSNTQYPLIDFVQVVESCTVLEQEYEYNSFSLKSWVHIVAVKLGDGFAMTFREISDRKQTEITLQKANQRLTYQANIDSLTQLVEFS